MATENELTVGHPLVQDFFLPMLGDPTFRLEIMEDPKKALDSRGMTVREGCEIRAVRNSEDTFHFVFPPDPNTVLEDESLAMIAGGKSAGTGACVGSAGCAGTVLSSASTASSASSASTAATAS